MQVKATFNHTHRAWEVTIPNGVYITAPTAILIINNLTKSGWILVSKQDDEIVFRKEVK